MKFDGTMPEFGCRHCRPFLKKGSAKNFPTGKVLGYFSKIVRSTFISSTPSFCRRKVGFNERLPPRGSCRTNVRLKEYACSIKFNNSMPRKTPSTANAVPLPQEGGLGNITPKTPHPPRQARHLLPLEKAIVRRYSDNRFIMPL